MPSGYRLGFLIASIASFAILASCSDRSSTLAKNTFLYDPTIVWQATRHGFQVVIRGTPFASTPAESNQRIVEALKLPTRFEPAPFILRENATVRSDYRLVLVFDPAPPELGFQDACGDLAKVALLAPSADIVTLSAAFCIGNRSITEVTAYGAPARDSSDLAFRTSLNQAIEDLLPNCGPRQPGSSAR